jgi:ribosome biogenesis protein Nip4
MCPMKRGEPREVTGSEARQVQEALEQAFGAGVTRALLKGGRLMRFEKKHPAVYQVAEPVYQLLRALKVGPAREADLQVQSAGLLVGFFRKGEFLIGVEQVRELGKLTEQWVEVTERGEQRFLYGNHLQKQSITAVSGALPAGARVVVRNRRKEALGIGVVVEAGLPLETLPAQREVIKHLTDLGTRYLRRGA